MTYQIDMRRALRKAADAYKAKKLSAFAEEYEDRDCQYRSETTGSPCVVGSMLPKDTMRAIVSLGRNGNGVSTLLSCGILSANEPDARNTLLRLQKAHDEACQAADQSYEVELRKLGEQLKAACDYYGVEF